MRRSRGLLLTAGAAVGVFVLTFLWARPDGVSEPAQAHVIDAPGTPTVGSASRGSSASSDVSSADAARPTRLAEISAAAPRNDPNDEPHDQGARGDVRYPVYDENAVGPASSTDDAGKSESIGAHPADQRAADLRAPVAAGTEDRRLAQLGDTLRTDEFARNRLLAVNELRKLGADKQWSPRVLEVLRAAQNDKDENVAANARDAIAELAR